MMKSTKSKKTSVLHYSMDVPGLKWDEDQVGEEDTTRLLTVSKKIKL